MPKRSNLTAQSDLAEPQCTSTRRHKEIAEPPPLELANRPIVVVVGAYAFLSYTLKPRVRSSMTILCMIGLCDEVQFVSDCVF